MRMLRYIVDYNWTQEYARSRSSCLRLF